MRQPARSESFMRTNRLGRNEIKSWFPRDAARNIQESARKGKQLKINGKVHCLFEQSGTFKNEFKKLGYEAFDYDIQNNFGETDCMTDLFAEIEKAYANESSIFDGITKDDLTIAFFPCIMFCQAK